MVIKDIQYEIPTQITFTLYKYDYIDSIIISKVLKECINYSTDSNLFKFKSEDFINVIIKSVRFKKYIEQFKNVSLDLNFKPNSLYFLWYIFNNYTNLEWVLFKISDDKEYTRLIKVKNNVILNFDFIIDECFLDLSKVLNISQIEEFNKILIKYNIISNNYLDRQFYFYIDLLDLIELLNDINSKNYIPDVVDILLSTFDPKLDEFNPRVLIKTDYSLI